MEPIQGFDVDTSALTGYSRSVTPLADELSAAAGEHLTGFTEGAFSLVGVHSGFTSQLAAAIERHNAEVTGHASAIAGMAAAVGQTGTHYDVQQAGHSQTFGAIGGERA
ncbi:hypothetical protein EV193_10675 [Herbihabitans rhizosphaerae]|uniref:Excreted virulence factor EspC (Type VII ESX diderm) n=1 Tax=Herbihabitans rhizosphaerae TaxID=1872711 RepID=A0A4Q7KMM5_9PSEU|nr:hypothetical protein [Herbihabitans rhizosphaerae]RZS36841.1 hypothetical protein EV193_10675 [Herbihabitans rhizosphaerae]